MNDLVSIIVPVYNVENYLSRCIESIINQTYLNLEIILVDDGSPDNSGEICDEYAKKDLRIKVLHNKNGGISAARNAGLEIASGDYICFVDSDDYIINRYVEVLYDAMVHSNADISVCNFIYKSNKQEKEIKRYSNEIRNSYDDGFYNELVTGFYANVVWNKLFRTNIIHKYSITFPINMSPGEDDVFLFRYIRYVYKAAYTEHAFYIHNDSDVSIMRAIKKKSIYENLIYELETFNKLIYECKESGLFSNCKFHYLLLCFHIIYDNKKYKLQKDINFYKQEIKVNWKFFCKFNISLRIKLRCFLMCISPRLFDLFKYLYEILRKLF